MGSAHSFAPHEDIASALLPFVIDTTGDASHGLSHLLRVWRNVQIISENEGGDKAVLTAATLLHDCADVPKDSPLRSSASRIAAQRALTVLTELGWARARADMVAHAVEAHSFSAGIEPRTLEARILQDADRLDAIGHVGIARCFYVSGRLGRALYDLADPEGAHRDLDDARFAIDHFRTKLLKLAGSFQTKTGRALGAERHKITADFLDGFLQDVSADHVVSGW